MSARALHILVADDNPINRMMAARLLKEAGCTGVLVDDGLKALAWCLLAIGAGGAVISPALPLLGIDQFSAGTLMRVERPTLAETSVMLGFAVLIVRTRIKEG